MRTWPRRSDTQADGCVEFRAAPHRRCLRDPDSRAPGAPRDSVVACAQTVCIGPSCRRRSVARTGPLHSVLVPATTARRSCGRLVDGAAPCCAAPLGTLPFVWSAVRARCACNPRGSANAPGQCMAHAAGRRCEHAHSVCTPRHTPSAQRYVRGQCVGAHTGAAPASWCHHTTQFATPMAIAATWPLARCWVRLP